MFLSYVDGGINCMLSQRWGLFQKQCQSSSIQCAATRYPRSSEHPLIQSRLFSGGQVAPLNGSFHGQAGCLPNMANTKAPESQIFNWSTSSSQRKKSFFFFFDICIFILNPLCRLIYSYLWETERVSRSHSQSVRGPHGSCHKKSWNLWNLLSISPHDTKKKRRQ